VTDRPPGSGWLKRLLADDPVAGAVRDGAPLVLALGAAGVAGWRAGGWHRRWATPLLVLTAWAAWFFRDPPRTCPGEPGIVYAPADGTVTAVGEVTSAWFVEGPALRLVTFLSLLDVHVTRSPVAGRVVAARREQGGYAPAFLVQGATGNARLLTGIVDDATGERVVLAQIVGLLARRIVPWRGAGDGVAAGQKMGLMRFGSRADVLLPAGVAEPLVRPGDRVRAGVTPVARVRSGATSARDRPVETVGLSQV
jgi:phosphatidylserine decarboxylase